MLGGSKQSMLRYYKLTKFFILEIFMIYYIYNYINNECS